jgi:hypothetical protein
VAAGSSAIAPEISGPGGPQRNGPGRLSDLRQIYL